MSDPVAARAVRVQVPAKLNLHLGVGSLRPDGYHELCTVFHAVDLSDEVVATPGVGITVSVDGPGSADVPTDEANLGWQAAARLAEHAGVAADVALHIDKRIPVAGGMAGGSADGAAALLACARLWNLELSVPELSDIAASFGSDTAFPLHGGTALGTGRGELLAAMLTTGVLHWALAVQDFGISAGAAYRELDRLRATGRAPEPAGTPDALSAALRAGDVDGVAATLVNDLQPAAISLAPQLADTLAAGVRLGALAGLVAGSGPTCAFLCRDADSAAELAAGLLAAGVCRQTHVTTGPAPGAQLLDLQVLR